MPQIYLGLLIHNHQPVGNFPSVFEEAYRKAYLPLLEALERHPSIRLSLHYSGPLLDWLKGSHPEFLSRLASLVKRGQGELVGGPYYEPILPAIPKADKLGQIAKMRGFLKAEFGVEAEGMWLPERVWEPHLPKSLAQAGVKWTLVDDHHFQMAGLQEEELFGYYITEEEGYPLRIFPSLKRLRYLIPWRGVEEVIHYLRLMAEAGKGIAVMGDDGEKFGIWPKTYRHCWEEGWVEAFFRALKENSSWLQTLPLGEYLSQTPPLGRVYLPTASYSEMLEWALPAPLALKFAGVKEEMERQGREDVLHFLRGGFWRHFLVKYPEANWLHKKMLRVSRKVHHALAQAPGDRGQEDLWKGQCSCAYWHGVFGGLYLADIRTADYRHLIAAEKKADALFHPEAPWLEVEEGDWDGDGTPEVIVESDVQALYFSPSRGGSLIEWDLRRFSFNALATLARRPEAYHQALARLRKEEDKGVKSIHEVLRVKEGKLPRSLAYDPLPRISLLDRFLPPETSLEDFMGSRFQELGDFAGKPYRVKVHKDGQEAILRFYREGKVGGQAFVVEKRLRIRAGEEGWEVVYSLVNPGPQPVKALFGIEWNINLLGGGHNEAAYYRIPRRALEDQHLDSRGEEGEVAEVTLGNLSLGFELTASLSPPATLWRFPVNTLSSSEEGLEMVYQGSCLLFLYTISLASGKEQVISQTWRAASPEPVLTVRAS